MRSSRATGPASTRGADFEAWWRRAVHDGVVPDTALPAKTPAINGAAIQARAAATHLGGKLEVIFRPDPMIYDGRFANNGWLQETPKPITKLTWDNAAIMSPATAHRLGVSRGYPEHAGGRRSHAGADLPGTLAARAGVRPAGPRGWRRDAAPGLRAHRARAAPATAWASIPTACAPPRRCGTTRASKPGRSPALTSSPPPRTSACSTAGATSSTRATSRST